MNNLQETREEIVQDKKIPESIKQLYFQSLNYHQKESNGEVLSQEEEKKWIKINDEIILWEEENGAPISLNTYQITAHLFPSSKGEEK